MSNAIQSFGVLYNNPFILSPVFPAFFKSLGEKPNGILLSYLVLPLVLPPASRKFLTNARSTSSLMTLAGKPGMRERLYGLGERIIEYRELTSVAIQHAIDTQALAIADTFSLRVVSAVQNNSLCPPNAFKSADRLGVLCAPFDVPTIYRMLGIKKI